MTVSAKWELNPSSEFERGSIFRGHFPLNFENYLIIITFYILFNVLLPMMLPGGVFSRITFQRFSADKGARVRPF
jgi:hypothetical protein